MPASTSMLACVDGNVVAVLLGAIVSGAIALERAEVSSLKRRHRRSKYGPPIERPPRRKRT